MEKATKLGKRLHVTYIDLAGANDIVPLDRLYQTLEAYGSPPRPCMAKTVSESWQTMVAQNQSKSHKG